MPVCVPDTPLWFSITLPYVFVSPLARLLRNPAGFEAGIGTFQVISRESVVGLSRSRPTAAQVLEHPALKAVSDAVRQPEAELNAGMAPCLFRHFYI